ncbi:Bifunctional uridylyltransferase/uridylyl-removing enzyme [Pseudobythopirellula maris]|uniref:Bifunctional uridylyltransferase/uridylyl-removing enzyme n=1 Tax=Pseudobythopirellula maris TaxID=2527991 RepID=A0A5C5ZJ89_9BACT|nr:Bifunctional uridylyltransferase/uridylyl-removing enzyme [Pseudobythopirellula maris]
MAAARVRLQEKREQIRVLHDRGLDPTLVCAKLTTVVDEVVSEAWRELLDDAGPQEAEQIRTHCALVAHGGYGRRRMAPSSDVDLMVLCTPDPVGRRLGERVAGWFTRRLFDVGLDLGQSLRTTDEALQLSRQDPVVATSLIESRHLVGDLPLFESYLTAITQTLRKRDAVACADFVAARRAERKKYGESVYVLEPNIKRSRGGLRDLHLLRWLWFIKTGTGDLDRLRSMDALSKFDHRRLCSARDFLLRTRNELHFHAGDAQDLLTRAEQLRLAEKMGYRDTPGLRAVESFMRDYFRHASNVWFLASRISELTAPKPAVERVLGPVMSRAIEDDYVVGMREISATASGREKLRTRTDEAIRLVDLARQNDRRIAQDTWYLVYRSAPNYDREPSEAASRRFLRVLSNPSRLGPLLFRLHELGVLERMIPEFTHARCLLQFNQYHKFTVDEHSIRAVNEATEFADREDRLGRTYRRTRDKRLLHLALLIHDLGKGRDRDHSELGEEIARETARRLRLSEEDGELLALLVRQHLSMSLLAFRRDTSDPEVVDSFAKLVGNTRTLTLLYLVTCADLSAVGPGVLNDWKAGVLADLYSRTFERLTDTRRREEDRRESVHKAVWALLTPDEQRSLDCEKKFNALPDSAITLLTPQEIAEVLRRTRTLSGGRGVTWGRYAKDGRTLVAFAAIDQGSGRGVFAGMAGALSSKGLAILSAETAVLEDGLLLLRFMADDPNASPPMATPPGSKKNATAAAAAREWSASRVDELCRGMAASIDNSDTPRFPRIWGAAAVRAGAELSNQRPEVRFDHQLSDEFTIVEVFAHDRQGLLYDLAFALHEMGLIIRFAKIATSVDRVVDVFYVTERDSEKLTDPERIDSVRARMLEVIGS